MSDLTAIVLMVIATLIALSIIWSTYVVRRLLEANAVAIRRMPGEGGRARRR